MAAGGKPADTEQAAARARYERDELLAISRALSSERDIRKLLDLILFKSRQITGADAGSVYVLEAAEVEAEVEEGGAADASVQTSPHVPVPREVLRRRSAALGGGKSGNTNLHFMLSQNDSMAVDFQEFTLKVDGSSIAGQTVLGGKPINIPDLGTLVPTDIQGLTHNRTFDQKTGYEARSMLTVPMTSAMGDVIGVVQLINKKREPAKKLQAPADFAAEVVPFDDRAEEMALALASQAGVSLENAILYDEIRRLFESFVDASVTAIESRDPTTSGHSRRVATLSVGLAEKVDAVAAGPLAALHFSRDDLRQLEYAGMLHDFGKVGVREHVLVKAKKLYDWQLAAVSMRFRFVRKSIEAEALRHKLAIFESGGPGAKEALSAIDADLGARLASLDECWQLVLAADEPTLMDRPALAHLMEIANLTYADESGTAQPFLTPDELLALQVPRGSLTADERQQIQSHVDHTIAFLRTIPWGRTLHNVPHIAGGHHELLDGSGYPRRLRGDEIPVETRMLTIADIFDALTASDRPYKSAVPVVRALGILEGEVKAGKCDADLFRLFVEAEVYKRVL
jgi:HD-GYP domain-containing protein (c-di-GMP phosphodiesterase class II)